LPKTSGSVGGSSPRSAACAASFLPMQMIVTAVILTACDLD